MFMSPQKYALALVDKLQKIKNLKCEVVSSGVMSVSRMARAFQFYTEMGMNIAIQ
jgi:hypothetical protein